LAERWRELQSLGTQVVVLLDNPTPGDAAPVYDCVATNRDDLGACTFNRAEGIASSGAPTLQAAAAEVEGVVVLDLTDHICPQERCFPVIGNVLVYRQGSHLTNTYAMSLVPQLVKQLEAAGLEPPN